MNGKSDDPKAGTKIVSERQLREAAKAALRKADRFWRLASFCREMPELAA